MKGKHFLVLLIDIVQSDSTFESVDEILKCDHSNESYRAILQYFHVVLFFRYAVQGGSNF